MVSKIGRSTEKKRSLRAQRMPSGMPAATHKTSEANTIDRVVIASDQAPIRPMKASEQTSPSASRQLEICHATRPSNKIIGVGGTTLKAQANQPSIWSIGHLMLWKKGRYSSTTHRSAWPIQRATGNWIELNGSKGSKSFMPGPSLEVTAGIFSPRPDEQSSRQQSDD